VPANTFVATFEAVSQVGARPVPVDASERDYNLDASRLEASISDRTRAVIPVHQYGQMADIRSVRDMATRHGFALLEDACQAHGAVRDDLVAGAAGHAGAFSFYPGKNLGAFGDAGALVSDDETLIERVKALREHGQREKYRHELIGYTARLDTIQALVLLRKLPLLSQWNEQRRAAARLYDEGPQNVGDVRLPPVPDGSSPVWHVYAVRTGRRDELAAFLRVHAIGTGRHCRQPAHLSAAYRHLGYRRGEFPVTEALADELLSLPKFPRMSESQVGAVVGAVREFFRRG
jgi:dTDP-4-amino-4,6-dideoxygalactose transaminase